MVEKMRAGGINEPHLPHETNQRAKARAQGSALVRLRTTSIIASSLEGSIETPATRMDTPGRLALFPALQSGSL